MNGITQVQSASIRTMPEHDSEGGGGGSASGGAVSNSNSRDGTDSITNDTESTVEIPIKRRQRFISQQSTVASHRQQAVCVRRAYKQYGSKRSPNVILDGLNMTVPKGTMYE